MKKIERECNMIEKKKWGNSLRVLKNQSGKYLANLCESNSLETQIMLPKVMNYPDFFFFKVQITCKLKQFSTEL